MGYSPEMHKRMCIKLMPAFAVLLEAIEYAEDLETDPWNFAVSISQLQSVNIGESSLRWLVLRKYVEQKRETTRTHESGRNFQSAGNLTFGKRTCFVLTQSGVNIARSIVDDHTVSPAKSSHTNGFAAQRVQPQWDPETRELRLGGRVIKRYKWQAPNQEIILSAFQEDGWPPVIDDPLPQKSDQDPTQRMQDTIKGLNRNHEYSVIRFHGNGAGDGIRWELLAGDEP